MQHDMSCSGAVPRERSMDTSSVLVDTAKHPFHALKQLYFKFLSLFAVLFLHVLVFIGFCPNTMIAVGKEFWFRGCWILL